MKTLYWRIVDGLMRAGEYTVANSGSDCVSWRDGPGGRVVLAAKVTLEHARRAAERDYARIQHLEKRP